MIGRRTLFTAAIALIFATHFFPSSVFAAPDSRPFSESAFRKAQAAGKPVLIEVHATWCSICRAQAPILGALSSQAKFKELAVFRIDFDRQKDDLKRLGVQMQSTLIVFKGSKEVGRSVGDTKRESIAALLDKSL